MTLTEKILARAAGKTKVEPGESVWVNVDILMTHDVCGPGTIGVFKREFGDHARVWDPNKIVIIPDHYIFSADEKANRNVDILRDFVRDQGIKYFYDVIEDINGRWKYDPLKGPLLCQYGKYYAGVCHLALAEKGHTRPGEVLLGTDSHTCTAGAFNEFATGIGNTDAGFVMGTGKLLLRVPETMHFILEGHLPQGVMGKDVILYIIGKIGVDGANYKAMQFDGPGLVSVPIEERMTIANMVIEAGAKNGIFAFDARTAEYVDSRCKLNGTKCEYEPVELDKDQRFCFETVIELDKIEPMVACPPHPGNCKRAKELERVRVDRAYIGSCTGGKLADFISFAQIVVGKRLAIETFGVPASPEVVYQLKNTFWGRKSIWEILIEAGVLLTENPSCAACLGGPPDTFGRVNTPATIISTTNRNFPGRMGHPEAQIYLASPATVAASALTGRITDPREVL